MRRVFGKHLIRGPDQGVRVLGPRAYYGPGGIGELRGAPAPALIMPQARDAARAARLWDVSEKLAETSFN
jgi:hypothetical protein